MAEKPPPTPYIPGEGVNYLPPRVQFYADECNRRRDANPQPNSTLTSGTNSPKRMRKSRGPSIYFCTQAITIISLVYTFSTSRKAKLYKAVQSVNIWACALGLLRISASMKHRPGPKLKRFYFPWLDRRPKGQAF